jgi:CMP-N-acetylneuraminic acid synthetase
MYAYQKSFGRDKMKIFIPIKHNSQRVPRKNFRFLNGEPLYKHVVLKYLSHDVYVDTDSEEILSELTTDRRFSKIKCYKRKKELTGDKISVCDLIKDFISRYDIVEPVVQTHVTSPFLRASILEEAYGFMKTHDSVVSCNSYNSRFWKKEEYGYCPINHNPLKLEQTQDLPTLFEENSAFYIFEPEVVKASGNRIGKNPYFFPMRYPCNIDIDTERDWEFVKEVSEWKR